MSLFFHRKEYQDASERISHQWEGILMEHAHRINEGQNGVIFEIDVTHLQPQERELLNASDEDTDQVAKLLKIGEPEKLRREYEMQHRAWKVIEEARRVDPNGYARIPEPTAFYALEPSASLKEWLENQDLRPSSDGRQELLVMDRVPGTDIDTCILRFFLTHSPQSIASAAGERLQACSHGELEQLAARSMGYIFPATPRRTWSDQDWRKYTQFRDEMEHATARLGFQLPSHLLDTLENSVEQLIRAGISWGDANLRNMMVEDGPSGEISAKTQAWLIDFGGAAMSDETSLVNLSRKDILRTLDRLRKTFVEAPRASISFAPGPIDLGKHKFPEARFQEWSQAVQSLFEQQANPPLYYLIQAVGGMQTPWHERLIPILARLASAQPQYRSNVIQAIESWFRLPQTATIVGRPPVKVALGRLYNELKSSEAEDRATA